MSSGLSSDKVACDGYAGTKHSEINVVGFCIALLHAFRYSNS